MRPILTADNPQSTMVFFHADTGVCVRYIARYITGLHTRMVSIAEDAVQVLVQADRPPAACRQTASARSPERASRCALTVLASSVATRSAAEGRHAKRSAELAARRAAP